MYTHDEILAMSEDELNHAIAKIKYGEGKLTDCGDFLFYDTGGGKAMPLPVWTRDIAAAYQLEGEITDPMDQLAYMDFLATYSEHAETKFTRWNLIHASPKERSRAWLMWKEGK